MKYNSLSNGDKIIFENWTLQCLEEFVLTELHL